MGTTRVRIDIRRWPVVLVGSIALTLPVAAQEPERKAEDQAIEKGLPASLSGFHDEGVFHLFKNESRLATMTFTWSKDGAFKGKCSLSMAGQTIETALTIKPAEDGRWTNMAMETPLGPVQVEREAETVRITFKEKTETLTLKPNTMLFENLTPALMSQAVRGYDTEKGGKQEFPLFIIPQVVMEGSLERKGIVERSVGGRDVTFTRYTYGVPGVDVDVWADDKGKIYLADVPAQHAAYVREGYEALRIAPEDDPLLSKPRFDIKEQRGLMIPMRDGVKLATDLYLPATEETVPLILVRTPYNKEMAELQAHYYTRRGYAVAVQDCRGRFASEGTWEPFVHEPTDGYDTIEWLAKQSWCNGKVGMIGASYLGWVQWWAARERPPHLVTIIPNVSPPDPFYNVPYEYGVYFLLGAVWWADVLESEATADLSGAAFYDISKKKYQKLLRGLPVYDLDQTVLGKKNPYWRKWIEHPTNDAYWAQANFLDHLEKVRLPVFHQSGWFDGDGIGTKLNYLRMVSHGHPHQKLVLGPWGHTPEPHRRVGDRDFGPNAVFDLQRDYLRWFDYWLKGVKNGILDEPLVSIFAMGSNEWLRGDRYPLPQTRFEKWYLASGGSANTSRGDGRLTSEAPPADAPHDRYTYDPGNPTPAPHFYEVTEAEENKEKSVEQKKKEREAYHEKVTQERKDILVYTSKPFSEPLTFAGPLSAVLYAASSAKDTDWFVRLMEVDKEGKIFLLAEGKLRARFRNSMKEPEFLEPGRVYNYDIDLWQTGITIPVGHRLRVEVASASFPLFSRNLNTGGHNEKETQYVPAEQTIYHDAAHPSHVLLPVIPKETKGGEDES